MVAVVMLACPKICVPAQRRFFVGAMGSAAEPFGASAPGAPLALPIVMAALGAGSAGVVSELGAGVVGAAVGSVPPPEGVGSEGWTVLAVCPGAGGAANDIALTERPTNPTEIADRHEKRFISELQQREMQNERDSGGTRRGSCKRRARPFIF